MGGYASLATLYFLDERAVVWVVFFANPGKHSLLPWVGDEDGGS
jgi:hypothetical protein